ncbi:MAG: hypothetical protein V3S33_06660 [Gammaproteobacteria bacterium]
MELVAARTTVLIIPGTIIVISTMINIADIIEILEIRLTIIATDTGMSDITTTVIADGMVTGVITNPGTIVDSIITTAMPAQ